MKQINFIGGKKRKLRKARSLLMIAQPENGVAPKERHLLDYYSMYGTLSSLKSRIWAHSERKLTAKG